MPERTEHIIMRREWDGYFYKKRIAGKIAWIEVGKSYNEALDTLRTIHQANATVRPAFRSIASKPHRWFQGGSCPRCNWLLTWNAATAFSIGLHVRWRCTECEMYITGFFPPQMAPSVRVGPSCTYCHQPTWWRFTTHGRGLWESGWMCVPCGQFEHTSHGLEGTPELVRAALAGCTDG